MVESSTTRPGEARKSFDPTCKSTDRGVVVVVVVGGDGGGGGGRGCISICFFIPAVSPPKKRRGRRLRGSARVGWPSLICGGAVGIAARNSRRVRGRYARRVRYRLYNNGTSDGRTSNSAAVRRRCGAWPSASVRTVHEGDVCARACTDSGTGTRARAE